jgi:dTMP kinase
VPPEVSLERLEGAHDRIEKAGVELFAMVGDAYRSLAVADPERWVVVDGTASIEEVGRQVDEALAERLGV